MNAAMKKFHRLILTSLTVASLFASNAAHAGIPVIDVANLIQAIMQVFSWVDQFQQMEEQYQQLEQQYTSVTGSRGLGDIANNTQLQGVVPANAGQVYSGLNVGGFGSLTPAAQSLRTASMVYNCEDRSGTDRINCQAVLNSNAQSMAYQQNALTLTTQRVSQIQSLQSQINSTQDPKAIAELQARIAAENTQVANDANRIAVMQALAASQKQAADQALKERSLKRLSATTPSSFDGFTFQQP